MMTLYIVFGVIFLMSVITFFLYGLDKHLAFYQRRRIPEAVLLILSFLCGAFGGLWGMILFGHKTQHVSFWICNILFLLLQVGILVFLFYHFFLPFL